MAVTEPAQARILRGVPVDGAGSHAFVAVADLPRITAARPGTTGNGTLDAIRASAWDEGYADGLGCGAESGYAEGFERGRTEGHRVGYVEGRSSAVADATDAVRREVETALAALDGAARDLTRREAVSLAQVEATVVDLALAVAEAVLQREVTVAAAPGADAMRRALALAPEDGALVAHLHPDDLDTLGHLAELAPGRSIQLVPDPSVGRGGAVVEAGAARLDARIETAMDRVREVLGR